MTVPRRVAWVALLAAGVAGCHHAAAPDSALYDRREGQYDFRMLGFTPQVAGRFTIAEGQVYLEIPTARCVSYAERKYYQPREWRGFECRGLPSYPFVYVTISLRDPLHNSTWTATNIAEEPAVVGRECIQTGLNSRGQTICLAYRTITSTRNAQKGGRLDVVRRGSDDRGQRSEGAFTVGEHGGILCPSDGCRPR